MRDTEQNDGHLTAFSFILNVMTHELECHPFKRQKKAFITLGIGKNSVLKVNMSVWEVQYFNHR